MLPIRKEKAHQERYAFERSMFFAEYNSILGHYQVLSCLEHAVGVSALDLACGDGMLTATFAEHFSRVVGVDASRTHLEKARRRISNAEFHESLIEDLKLEETFDTVLMLNVLEHVYDPVRVLKHAATFLKKGGVLIAHVPNAEAINRRLAVLMGTLRNCEELSPFDLDVAGHRRSYNIEGLEKDVQKAGLRVKATGGIFYKMLSTAQMEWLLKRGPWKRGGFGWGRVGEEKAKDWKAEFCRACYELGKTHPGDCNIIYVVAQR